MASLFQPASAVERRLKVLAYGPPGTGKSWFGLSFSKAGREAVIDTEGGTALYGSKFTFDVIRTKDFAQVLAAVDEIKRDGGKTYKTLMIDPITVLWQTLQDAGQLLAERRQGKSGIADVVLTQRDWGIIKRQYARLMTDLVNLPLNVVLIAREKDIIGANDVRQGVKPDAEKSTPYLPDIILRFTGGAEYAAVVEKDRSGTYPLGTKIANPTYASFIKAVSHGAAMALPSEDDAATGTAHLLDAESGAQVWATPTQMQAMKTACGLLGRDCPADAELAAMTYIDLDAILSQYRREYRERQETAEVPA